LRLCLCVFIVVLSGCFSSKTVVKKHPYKASFVNEFGLVQLTKHGHKNIINNHECEDSYNYKLKNNKLSLKQQHGDDWATPPTATAFIAAVEAFLKKGRRRHVKFIINDVSAYNPRKNLGHQTHFTGHSIDLRFLTANGKGSNDIHTLKKADIVLNKDFIIELKKQGFRIFYCHKGIIPGTRHAAGHHNHLHVAR
jgi:hypothetical protein